MRLRRNADSLDALVGSPHPTRAKQNGEKETERMTKTQQMDAITKADLEIKKQHAELLKAQARRENAEADSIEARNKKK
jgi:hypothetical protein